MITQNIIGFDLSALSEKRKYAFNPADNTPLPEAFIPSTPTEVDLAMTKAHNAWREFRIMEGSRRGEFLSTIADGIELLDDILVNRMMLETAYSQARVLTERRRTVNQLRMYAEIVVGKEWKDITIDLAIPGRMPAPRPDLRKINIGIGPVIVFAASNFPLAYSTMGGDAVSAIAAGCPVIVKSHESHLGTNALIAEVVMKAAQETGMPDGVFSSLNSDGHETGKLLVLHPYTAAVGFTGSLSGGRALFDLANQRPNPIPVFAEMGSVNPIFFLPGKVMQDITSLADMLVTSMTMSVGQFCTNPGIMIALDQPNTSRLIQQMANKLIDIPAAPMLNENIAGSFHKSIATIKSNPQINLVYISESDTLTLASPVLATVPAKIFLSNLQLHLEVFGPFSLIVLCTDANEMLQVANSFEGQLTATIHCTDEEYVMASDLTKILVEKAGRIIYNGVPTGVEVCAAMNHGGPYPASTDSRYTAVGHHAIRRWLRPVSFQDCPPELLPPDLREP
ncbi:MAG: aldehyde dehydrogenase (NADP(+)) [Bacteroidota bacterium]|nr:aldehyde dehydrogenase (NADP(+)) [Bacteroidota bacterium]